MTRPVRGRFGFTMVDVVITVLIIGIMAAVAVPRFVDSLHRHRADAAAAKIQADLEYARRTAMARSTQLTVQFAAASNDYTLVGIDRPDRVGESYHVTLSDHPFESTLVSASLGGDEAVQFNQYGVPDSGGTITVKSGSYQQTITLNADTGHARVP